MKSTRGRGKAQDSKKEKACKRGKESARGREMEMPLKKGKRTTPLKS